MKYIFIKYGINLQWRFAAYLISKLYVQSNIDVVFILSIIEYFIYFHV